jgi:hypothetical protein
MIIGYETDTDTDEQTANISSLIIRHRVDKPMTNDVRVWLPLDNSKL